MLYLYPLVPADVKAGCRRFLLPRFLPGRRPAHSLLGHPQPDHSSDLAYPHSAQAQAQAQAQAPAPAQAQVHPVPRYGHHPRTWSSSGDSMTMLVSACCMSWLLSVCLSVASFNYVLCCPCLSWLPACLPADAVPGQRRRGVALVSCLLSSCPLVLLSWRCQWSVLVADGLAQTHCLSC